MRSNELIMLEDINTGEIVKIVPNTEFDRLPIGKYKNYNEARIVDNEGKTLSVLKPGARVETKPKEIASPTQEANVGTKPKELTKSQLREILRTKGISFTQKATRDELLGLIND